MKTVRVRIAVAVNFNGDWYASGSKAFSDKIAMECATELLPDGKAVYWVEATLPIPDSQAIEGSVCKG